jgi:hypothetical protein
MNTNNLHFFLGGNDLEMKTIKNLLDEQGVAYSDANLSWGASTSKYGDEISEVAAEGKTPVIVELAVDSKLPENTINVDHHNENSDKPASILQVCELLGVEPTRKMQLVAANDSGYIPAMMAMGASETEINAIRYQDRATQGITLEQEEQAEFALQHTKEMYGVTVVMLKHSKTATVTDRLFDETKPQNLLIISQDGETNYFGPEDICRKLQGNKVGERPAPWDPNQTEVLYDHFGGWTGGAGLGQKGGTAFWGGYADQKEILKFVIKENFEKQQDKTATSQMDVAALKALTDFKFEK